MLYLLGRAVFRFIFKVVFRWRVTGREHLPAAGPYLLCANHTSWWDPPLVGSIVEPKVYFMAKEELFRVPVLGPVIRAWGAYPVKRHSADRKALRRSLELLEEGKVLGIFAEGTRSRNGRLQKAEGGAAWLARKSGAPVVPVGIAAPYRLFKPLQVRIGPPLRLQPGVDVAEASEAIMQAIASLLPRGE